MINFYCQEIKDAAAFYRVVNNANVKKILSYVQSQGKCDVTTIYQDLRLPQPVCSRYLAQLRFVCAVLTERQGKHILYSINYLTFKSYGYDSN